MRLKVNEPKKTYFVFYQITIGTPQRADTKADAKPQLRTDLNAVINNITLCYIADHNDPK